jgi:hypothetical protein
MERRREDDVAGGVGAVNFERGAPIAPCRRTWSAATAPSMMRALYSAGWNSDGSAEAISSSSTASSAGLTGPQSISDVEGVHGRF